MMRRKFLYGAALVAVSIVLFYANQRYRHSDALWHIISQQCIPHQQQRQNPTPCERVDLVRGYVLLKDKVGLLQYLLMPTQKVSGVESPQLLASGTPDYFALAWSHLDQLSKKWGQPIPKTDLALTLNSRLGRTQNQLHIHMSCLRSDVKQQLALQQSSLTGQWQKIHLHQHTYWVRTLAQQQLSCPPIFQRITQELPQLDLSKGNLGIALAQLADGRFALLVLKVDLLSGSLGSAEELQDHDCRILGNNIAA